MKKIMFLCLLGLATFLGSSVYGQKMKLVSGNLSFIKGEKAFNVEYVYDGMRVGKYKTEDEYIQKKSSEYNSKEAGKGEKWAQSWKADRAAKFQPKFEELINKMLKDKNVSVSPANSSAKYTIIVKTVFTEPGWNVYVSKQPAFVDFEVYFIETANPQKVLASISMKKTPGQGGMGFDYDTGFRIQEAYAKGGKSLGKFMLKNGLK